MLNQINQMMARALQCFQSGNHDEAELILIKVLGTQPKNFDALHILHLLFYCLIQLISFYNIHFFLIFL